MTRLGLAEGIGQPARALRNLAREAPKVPARTSSSGMVREPTFEVADAFNEVVFSLTPPGKWMDVYVTLFATGCDGIQAIAGDSDAVVPGYETTTAPNLSGIASTHLRLPRGIGPFYVYLYVTGTANGQASITLYGSN